MDHDALVRFVHEALEHLHSRSYLARHPLARELGVGQEPASADFVRQTLLDAIEQLKPVADAPAYDADRRRYRQLVLRYVEGQTLEQAARILDVSPRQASRDHQQALAALAGLVEAVGRDRRAGLASPSPPPATDATGLAEEAAKVAASEDGAADLPRTLEGALGLVERLAADRAVSFVLSLGNALPPVAIGPTLLRQALLNLLVYTCEAAPHRRAIISATDSARGVILRVTVRDGDAERPGQPPGAISPETRRLLEAARQLLQAQGGLVEAVEGAGTGTLVRVVLPPIPLREILLVDDNPELASLFRRYLRDEPYRVIQAISGTHAESLARELRPDLIILDVMIPSQDGWETLQRLRADPETRGTPVVICSVLPEQTLALSLGVDQFLAKPVSRSALLATLQRWCSGPADRAGHSSPSA